jgi:hypothetical protein
VARTSGKDPAARRRALLRVVRQMEWRRDGAVPWGAETAACFASTEEVVLAVHARWHRVLAVRLDPLLERGCTAEEVVAEWWTWAAETPGQRAVLDAAAADPTPALRLAADRQDALLAAAAGLAPVGADAGLAAEAWRFALRRGAETFRRPARLRTRCPALQRWRCRREEARLAA